MPRVTPNVSPERFGIDVTDTVARIALLVQQALLEQCGRAQPSRVRPPVLSAQAVDLVLCDEQSDFVPRLAR
eukprot:3288856-Prymnesium_polylepis.1